MTFDTLMLIFVAVIGLCCGSFYNVVILRGLSGESIAFPGSKCPKCSTPLKWWHNIPVISYLLLRGKCGFCGVKISPQYPIVELATMAIFFAAYLKWGLEIKTIFICAFLSLFLITTVTDILERVILTRHAYILAGLGLAYAIYNNAVSDISWLTIQNPIIVSIIGAIVGAIVMELMARVGYLFVGSRAFGEGDTFIAAALGAVFGFEKILTILLIGFVVQFVCSLPMFLWNMAKSGKWKMAAELPLFLILSGLLWFWGVELDKVVYMSGVALLAIMALHLIRAILGDIKAPSAGTYLPYVPALMVGATAVLFLWF